MVKKTCYDICCVDLYWVTQYGVKRVLIYQMNRACGHIVHLFFYTCKAACSCIVWTHLLVTLTYNNVWKCWCTSVHKCSIAPFLKSFALKQKHLTFHLKETTVSFGSIAFYAWVLCILTTVKLFFCLIKHRAYLYSVVTTFINSPHETNHKNVCNCVAQKSYI